MLVGDEEGIVVVPRELADELAEPAIDRQRRDRPLPLTQRERLVATLAARGLTNSEIAERLVISVRTVGNHLHSVYAKLGMSGREELRLCPGLM